MRYTMYAVGVRSNHSVIILASLRGREEGLGTRLVKRPLQFNPSIVATRLYAQVLPTCDKTVFIET